MNQGTRMRPREEITYQDERLADGTVHRNYADGRREWRQHAPDGTVHWRDDQGNTGTDEALGRHLVKRASTGGPTLYGREAGYGRTLWSDEVLTVNRSSFTGRTGVVLATLGAGVLAGALIAPPMALSEEQEEALREEARAQAAGAGTGVGGEAGLDDSQAGQEEYEDWDGDVGFDDGDFG